MLIGGDVILTKGTISGVSATEQSTFYSLHTNAPYSEEHFFRPAVKM
jgi:hypothetical protein